MAKEVKPSQHLIDNIAKYFEEEEYSLYLERLDWWLNNSTTRFIKSVFVTPNGVINTITYDKETKKCFIEFPYYNKASKLKYYEFELIPPK